MSEKVNSYAGLCKDSISWTWTLHDFFTFPITLGTVLEGPPFVSSILPRILWRVRFIPKFSRCIKYPSLLIIFPDDKVKSTLQLLNLTCDCECSLKTDYPESKFVIYKGTSTVRLTCDLDELKLKFDAFSRVKQPSVEHLALECTFTLKGYLKPNDTCANIDPAKEPKCLSENLKELYFSNQFSDFTIVVKDEKFFVHKAILCARSPVFAAMIRNDTKESTNNKMFIEDVDAITMRHFIVFLYTDHLEEVSPDMHQQLYTLSDKYAVSSLRSTCAPLLLQNLNPENVCDLFALGYFHSDDFLNQKIKQFILQNYVTIFKSKNFKRIMKENAEIASKIMDIVYDTN